MKRNKIWRMRVIIWAGLILGFLVSSPPPAGFSTISAQELKIGYVDVQRLKAEYKEYVQAQEKFSKLMAKLMPVWRAKGDSIKNEINELQKKVEKPPITMREEAIKELQEKLLVKVREDSLFRSQVDSEAAQKEYELSKPLFDKINAVIRLIALKENYAYVLDSTAGTVLYAKDELDITNKVLAELNK